MIQSLDEVVFFGRTPGQYEKMFSIKIPQLLGLSILDCPGGPSSFQCASRIHGINTVSVDPMYSRTRDELEIITNSTFEKTIQKIRVKPELYPEIIDNLEAYIKSKNSSIESFLNDFSIHGNVTYIPASLPELPFNENQFDLTLSGHLLFSYTSAECGGVGVGNASFDLDWHRNALYEMIRVTKSEIRIYPISAYINGEWNVHEYATILMDELQANGFICEIYSSSYRPHTNNFGMIIHKKTD
eukprot:gene7239-9870_t